MFSLMQYGAIDPQIASRRDLVTPNLTELRRSKMSADPQL
jgi:hypothetical protein